MRFCFQVGVGVCVVLTLGCALSKAAAGVPARTKRASTAVPVSRVDPRTGQQVRTIVVAPKPARTVGATAAITTRSEGGQSAQKLSSNAAPDPNVKVLVEEAAQKYDVNAALIDSVMQVESNYNPFAVSPKGALGLMQLMPETAKRFGVQNAFDPRDNILGGVKYLKFLQDTFKDDRLAVAAYNAGEGAVAKYNDVPPYRETQDYVAKVGKRYKSRKGDAASQTVAAAALEAKPEKPNEPQYAPVRQYQDAEGRIYLTTQ
jgi:soluble lytic murein transglycosylase-like protein